MTIRTSYARQPFAIRRCGLGRGSVCLAFAVAIALGMMGCGSNATGDPPTVSLLAVAALPGASRPASAQPMLAGGGIADVASVGVSVFEANNGPNVQPRTDLTEVQAGLWQGTLGPLPVGISLDFIGTAYDITGLKTLYQGVANETLSLSGPNTVQLGMSAVDVGPGGLPVITTALIPVSIGTLTTGNLISIGIAYPSPVAYVAGVTGGTIAPTSGTFDPATGGLLGLQYDAPLAPGQYALTVTVWDPATPNATVSTQFPLTLVVSTVTATASALFGPAITGIHFTRTATGLQAGLDISSATAFGQSWAGTGSFAGITGASTNPLVIAGFTDTMAGTLTATVTDANSSVTSVSYTILAGAFPYVIAVP